MFVSYIFITLKLILYPSVSSLVIVYILSIAFVFPWFIKSSNIFPYKVSAIAFISSIDGFWKLFGFIPVVFPGSPVLLIPVLPDDISSAQSFSNCNFRVNIINLNLFISSNKSCILVFNSVILSFISLAWF